jgi:hypothetical protein
MQSVVQNSISQDQIRNAFKEQAEFVSALRDPNKANWELSHMGAPVGQISIIKRELLDNAPHDLARVNFVPGVLPNQQTRILIKPVSHNLNVSAEHYDTANKFIETAQALLNMDSKLTMNSVLDVLQINYAPRPKDLPELSSVKFLDPNKPLVVLYGAGGRMTGFIGDIKLSSISLKGQSNIKPLNPLESANINGLFSGELNGF